jgi:hypothetical protein
MDFEINSHRGYRILFHSQVFDRKGLLTHYSVTLETPHMEGTVQVDNSPYGPSPVGLFEQIANEWKGWKGEISWGSLEGELDLVATSDSTGHVTFAASIRSGYIPPEARLSVEFIVEAGQMDRHHKQAKEFFIEDASNK